MIRLNEPEPNHKNTDHLDEYWEPKTAGGCTLSHHLEITRGKKKFEPTRCAFCGLDVYPA